MNKTYKLVFNRKLGALQVAAETASSAGKSGASGGLVQALKPLSGAVLLALLGGSPMAMANGGDCLLSGTGSLGGTCTGTNGAVGTMGSPAGGSGTAAGAGDDFDLISDAVFSAGAGGAGYSNSEGSGGSGGAGGIGLSGTGFSLVSNGNISGAAGGAGGSASFMNHGGSGGAGGVGVSGADFSLTNNATIQGGAGGASGSSVFGAPGGAGAAGVSGSAFTLINTGTISGGAGGAGFMFSGTGGAGVVSTGGSTIRTSGTISGGIGGVSSSNANAITFSGGGNTLILEDGYAFNGNVVATAAGDDVLALGGSADSAFSLDDFSLGHFQNFAALEKVGSSLWALSGNSEGAIPDVAVKEGTLQVGNSTALQADVSVDSGATLQLASSIITGDLNNSGTLQLGHTGSPYAYSSLGGDLTLGGGSVFSIAATSNDSEGGYSRMGVSGTASIAGTAFVNVAEANTLAVGQTLVNVISAGTLSGNFSEVQDNSALFNFSSLATAGANGHVDFEIVQAANTSVTSSTQANNNNPALGAAQVLDQIIASGSNDPGMQQVVTTLGQLETGQQVSDAASQTLPLLVGSSQAAAGNASNAIGNVLQGRQGGGQSSGEAMLAEGELWLQPFGTWANQDERDGVAGFDVDTYGLVFGGDAALNEQTRLGLAIAYANSNVNGDSQVAPNSADMDLYQLIGYGSHDFDAATQLTWQLDYGQGRTDGQRQILFMGSTAKSSYTSQIAHAGVGLSHSYSLGTATELTPTLRADYSWIKDDSYQEKGAGALNLDVDGRTTDSLILALEGELSHAFDERLQGVLKLGVGYDVIGEQATITSAYAGEPGLAFVTQGLDPSPWLGLAGMGLNYRVSDSTELSANYDAAYREDFLSHSASLTARLAF